MYDGEATTKEEANDLRKDEGARRSDLPTKRVMDGRKRASNALKMGAVSVCAVRVGRLPPHDVLGSGQRSPGFASPL